MNTKTLRRLGLAFRIEWWLRGVFAVLLLGCAPVKRCRFPVWVNVTPTPTEDCMALPNPPVWTDSGKRITDRTRLAGCSPKGEIITNGTESNMGHEMKHQVDRNCLKP